MYKYFSIIFVVFFVKLSISQEVTATQQIPKNIASGTEYIAIVTINKGINNSYMKFSQRLPPTFTASEIDSKNGKFSFKDGLVKIAWVFPPSFTEFTISFKVIVAKEDTGNKIIKGKVYYYFNTHKKFFQLEPHTISVSNEYYTIEKDSTIATDTAKTTFVNSAAYSDSVWTSVSTTVDSVTSKTVEIIPAKDSSAVNKKIYRVQILAIKERKFEEIPEIFFITDNKGITKYFSGSFSTYDEAVVRKKYMIDIGFEGAFIVTFENGENAPLNSNKKE